jgi:DNA polymerase-1
VRRVAFDLETHLIRPGMLFPKVVCVSISDGSKKDLFLAPLGVREIISLLRDPNVILIGHNVSFDLGCIIAEAIDQGYDAHEIITLVFQAYADDRIADTMIRTMLVDIAKGTFQEIDGQRRGRHYALDVLVDRWLGIALQKKDTWRLHYAALDGVPLAQWPQDAIDYAIKDAEFTWLVDQAITQWAITEGLPAPGNIPDEFRQHRAAWVLHLMAGWGVHIDSGMVAEIRSELERQRAIHYIMMDQYGLFKKDKLGNFKLTKKGQRSVNQKVLKQYVAEGYATKGEQAPTTAGRKNKQGVRIPETAIDADTCLASGHPAAIAYAEVSNTVKLLSTYVPALERGRGGKPVTSNPNVLVASGRTSWTGPNWQNPPKVGGIRECVIPRPGRVFVAADLDTVELRALAQSCLELLGHSEMASALKRGEDLHTALAAEILGIDYAQAEALLASGDPTVEDGRHTGKQVNFGLPGGMGAPKFAQTAIDNGSPLIRDPHAPFSEHVKRAKELKDIWFRRWPEMRAYLQNASDITGDFGPCAIEQPWSGRLRGGLDYCSCANTYFQGRVADGAKLALWRLAWACYVDKSSVLYGSRLVLFLHDEVILECPENLVDECGSEIVKILCGAVQEVIPDIPITSRPTAFRRWYKGAKPVKINGKLVPCKPEKNSSGKIKWIADA